MLTAICMVKRLSNIRISSAEQREKLWIENQMHLNTIKRKITILDIPFNTSLMDWSNHVSIGKNFIPVLKFNNEKAKEYGRLNK